MKIVVMVSYRIRLVLFGVRNSNDSFSMYNSKFSTRTNIEVLKYFRIYLFFWDFSFE